MEEFLTNESVIHLVDGTKIEGAKNIDKFIFKCCKEYNYKSNDMLAKGILVGGAICIAAFVTVEKLLERRKKTQK